MTIDVSFFEVTPPSGTVSVSWMEVGAAGAGVSVSWMEIIQTAAPQPKTTVGGGGWPHEPRHATEYDYWMGAIVAFLTVH